MRNKSVIVRNFSKSAYIYDEYAGIQRLTANYLIDEIPKIGLKRILEIGCGTGIYTRLLQKEFRFSRIQAVDISENMIMKACENMQSGGVEFETVDAEKMILEEKYDLITSNSVFHWFESMEKAISRFSNALNKGGWLVFSVFGPSTFFELASSLRKISKESNMQVASCDFWEKEKLEKVLAKLFSQISVKEVTIQREYPSLTDLLREIKYTGTQGHAARGSPIWTKGLISALEGAYIDDNGRIVATYQIFLCRASG
jgi:malonyl-CoA O-methyltransferase